MPLKQEWAFWRRIARQYGFGRHQLQPLRETGTALGRYLGTNLRMDWEQRLPEDRGARCVRYFGHWSAVARSRTKRRVPPPHNSRFGWMTPRARAWRELVKQVVTVLQYRGTPVTEANIKEHLGPKWAWKVGKLAESVQFVVEDRQAEAVRAAIADHNFRVQVRWLADGGDPARSCWWHVTEISLDHLRPSPAWAERLAALREAKQVEVRERRRLERLEQEERIRAEQERLLLEVAACFLGEGGQP